MKQSAQPQSDQQQKSAATGGVAVGIEQPVVTDNRASAISQRALMALIERSPMAVAQRALSDHVHNGPRMAMQRRQIDALSPVPVQRQAGIEDEPMQGKFASGTAPLQKKEEAAPTANNTGMPDNLKAGIENLSGMSMDDVKVHYNSSQPAQMQAHAYAQGSDIHVAPGQEQHLPHEAWHVVQQRQGRVQPTMQMNGAAINDDVALEHEADVMGGKAVQMRLQAPLQKQDAQNRQSQAPIQRAPYNTKASGDLLSLYTDEGAEAAKVPGGVELEIDKTSIVRLEADGQDQVHYKVTAGNGHLQDQADDFSADNVYICIFDVVIPTSEMVQDAVDAGDEYAGGEKQALGEIDQAEVGSACWNWALTAYQDDGLRPDFIFGGFFHLRFVFGDEQQDLDEQPEIDEMIAQLDAYRDETAVLKDSDVQKGLFNNLRNGIAQQFRTWKSQNPVDDGEEGQRADDVNYESTLELTKMTVQANGFALTEGDDKQFYICMHEKKGNVGYEHWWIEDLAGNVMQKFPKNYIDQDDHSKGEKGREITYQNTAEGDADTDFTYKIGIADLKDRHKEIILKDLNAILAR